MKSHPLFYIWLWSIFKNVKFWSQGAYSNFIDVYLLIFILHALHRRLHRDRHRMRDILNLHLVRDRLNTERIRQGNLQTVSCIPFLSLFFLLYSLTVHSFLSQFETFFPRLTSIVMQSQNFHKLYEVQDHWTMDKFVFFSSSHRAKWTFQRQISLSALLSARNQLREAIEEIRFFFQIESNQIVDVILFQVLLVLSGFVFLVLFLFLSHICKQCCRKI